MRLDNSYKLNYWLTPIAFLYEIGVRFRNQLFNWGILRVEQYDIPVICIGNIAVGGTGKTPHTEFIIRKLKKQYKIAVLSRGYKRKTKGFVLSTPESTSKDIGDEPFQIKRKHSDIIVAVDEDRRNGIKRLLALPETERPEVILLDDGFQHRYVKPSFTIMLTEHGRMFYDDKLMPVGRLREPIIAVRRADMVVVTKCPKLMKPIEFRILEDHMHLLAHQDVYFSYVLYDELRPLFPDKAPQRVKRDIRKDDEVLILSGIANPDSLVKELKRYSGKVIPMSFPDHHNFTKNDIEKINADFKAMTSSEKIIVVTEKDAARLIKNPSLPENWKERLYIQPISIKFHNDKEENFIKAIKKHIEVVKRHGIQY